MIYQKLDSKNKVLKLLFMCWGEKENEDVVLWFSTFFDLRDPALDQDIFWKMLALSFYFF